MNIEPRDSIQLQQNRQGVVDPNVTADDLHEKAMECLIWGDEPRKGLEHFWVEEAQARPHIHKLKTKDGKDFRCIRILDSFFSDTLTEPEDIRPHIVRRALKGVHVEFLLAHPRGPFGIARADAIGQDAVSRSAEGLKRLARACNAERVNAGRGVAVKESQIRECDPDKDWDKIAEILLQTIGELPIEVRLYDRSPSGPYYFFSDLLLAGRFWAGRTAAFYPWSQITDTPYPNDLYDTMLSEYYEIWDTATPLAGPLVDRSATQSANRDPKRVFISYISKDRGVAEELKDMFGQVQIEAYLFQSDLKAGQTWNEPVREELANCDALIAIVSSAVVDNSEWVRAEVGAAWVNSKRLFQAQLGTDKMILPGIMGQVWSPFDVATASGKQKLVTTVAGPK
ncbi:MAG TPA: toll/interleukin-1 receptor domain-containing protein [Caulobacterales bacterium]|nr:toll/interleukin-1 receptor domain-containing protein [Caulobacterales bacterium]